MSGIDQQKPGGSGQTFFAPADRASPEALRGCVEIASKNPVIDAVLHAFGGVVAVLNAQRQIVAVNSELLRRLGVEDPDSVLGLRPGEAFSCSHVADAPSGCGTGQACRDCGAAIAIVLSAQQNQPVERDCLVTMDRDGERVPLEFAVRASPTEVEGTAFTVVLLQDIADRKRRENLERVFFHDILNSMGALRSYADLLAAGAQGDWAAVAAELGQTVSQVIDEVCSHRDLSTAERGEYQLRLGEVAATDVLGQLRRLDTLDVARGKALHMRADPGVRLVTDTGLLLRVLTNMVKNALEAAPPDGEVRVRSDADTESVTFRVWNAGAMDDRVARRVFQRSFTTKAGAGRGLGTYSMKLFGEQYLAGEVGFTTSSEHGTEFTLRLPRALTAPG